MALIRQQKVLLSNSEDDQAQDQRESTKTTTVLPEVQERDASGARQLPMLLGRSRPAPLNLSAELPLPMKVSVEQHQTPVLRLSDRV